ncbi:RHS repeat-associated core domain-containing protein, partial [Streptomyces sp. S9]|nr:RHS repeat-associated core domain-containing protein [Streptomyces sp. S9]
LDAASGLVYNYYRDYDPATGRYVQSDPIGLDGGINSFAYVANSPLDNFDEFGLVDYNAPAPRTVPVTGTTAHRLDCTEACLQRVTRNPNLSLLVT